jgi:hypothetical protein
MNDQDRQSSPAPVGELIDAVLARLGGGARPGLLAVSDHWEELVGERWRDRCRPVGIVDGTLVVEVVDGAHASLLRYDLDGLRQRLARRLPGVAVTRIRLRVAAGPGPGEGR